MKPLMRLNNFGTFRSRLAISSSCTSRAQDMNRTRCPADQFLADGAEQMRFTGPRISKCQHILLLAMKCPSSGTFVTTLKIAAATQQQRLLHRPLCQYAPRNSAAPRPQYRTPSGHRYRPADPLLRARPLTKPTPKPVAGATATPLRFFVGVPAGREWRMGADRRAP